MFSDQHRRRFLKKLEKNRGNLSLTCRQMGIRGSYMTIKKWKDKYPWFREAVEDIVHREFDDIEANVFEAAVSGPPLNPTAMSARRFLLCYHPEGRRRGYGRRHELQGHLEVRSFVDLVLAAEREQAEAAVRRQLGDGGAPGAGSWLLAAGAADDTKD